MRTSHDQFVTKRLFAEHGMRALLDRCYVPAAKTLADQIPSERKEAMKHAAALAVCEREARGATAQVAADARAW